MDVDVAGMAWLPRDQLGADGIAYMKKQLRIVPKRYQVYDDTPTQPLDLWIEDLERDRFGIPRRYFFETASVEKGHRFTWSYSEGAPMRNIECLLRQEGKYAEQADAIAEVMGWYRVHDERKCGDYTATLHGASLDYEAVAGDIQAGLHLGALLRGATGFGKTNTGLALAHRLGLRTAVVVHKEFLLRQWVNRIHEFFPGARVGIVQGPKCEFDDCDFVIAMAHSLAKEGEDGKERYPREFYESIGFLMIDECHRIGAETWSPIPTLFPAKYRLGLTATPRRKDGCDKVFWWNIGEIVFAAKSETPIPAVRVIESGSAPVGVLSDRNASPAVIVNVLTKLKNRNARIVDEVMKALRSPQGRKIFVISERLEQLRKLEEAIREQSEEEGIPDFSTGFYVGEWFTGESTLSLRRARKLTEEERARAIQAIFRKFRRRRWIEDDKGSWPCGIKLDAEGRPAKTKEVGKHYVALYDHGYRVRVLEDMPDKHLCLLARDYDVKQGRSKPKTKQRTEEELIEAERARVIFATYQMCSEGVDIPAIDTEVLASPVSDVEQAAGRERRWCIPKAHGGEKSPEQCEHYCAWRADRCTGKPDPILTDIVDNKISLSAKRKKYRLAFYNDIGAKVAGAV